MRHLLILLALAPGLLAAPVPFGFWKAPSVSGPPALPSFVTAAYIPSSIVATGATITGWNDVSGNGHHITVVTGTPQLVTVGTETWASFTSGNVLTLPASLSVSTQNASAFCVSYSDRLTGSGNMISMGDGMAGASVSVVGDSTASGLLNRTPNSTSAAADKLWSGFGWTLHGMISSASGRQVWMESETKTLSVAASGTNTGGYIGRWANSATGYWVGAIKAAIIVNTALTAPQLAELRQYCQYYHRVGTVTATAVVATDGDSLTAGNGNVPWPVFFGSNASSGRTNMRPKFRNFATGGHTTASILSGQADALNWLGDQPSTFTRKIYVVLGGTNDWVGTPLATTQSNITALVAAAHARGFEAVVLTVPAATDSISHASRLDYNTWLLAGNSGADHVVNIAAVAGLTNPADTAAYSDGVHFTSAGSKLVAEAVYSVLFP